MVILYPPVLNFSEQNPLFWKARPRLNPYNPAAIWGNYIQFVEGVKDEENISRARAQKGVKGNNIELLCSLSFNKTTLL